MKLTIEPSERFFMAGDVMVRAWTGHNEQGEDVVVLVSLVMFPGQFEFNPEGLVSIPPPTAEDAKRWAKHVLEHPDD